MNTIGERIKISRKSRGYSQDELGRLIGVQGTAIGNYERGEREPDRDTIEALADVFNTTMGWLMGDGEKDEPVASDKLSKEEQEMLDIFRTIAHSKRGSAIQLLKTFAESLSDNA